MPKVEYVGRKPREIDSKAGTGVVWNGHGDVQEVPDWAVPKLIRYADMWRLVDGEKVDPEPAPVAKEIGEEQLRYELTLRMNDMDKEQLEAYALANWNINLDRRRSVENLRIQINNLIDQYGLPG